MSEVSELIEALELLIQDDVPKTVSTKLSSLVVELKKTSELSLTINKSISELEDLSNDVNIPAFVRTQIWGILSILGALEAEIVKA